jgi:acetyl-CoA carboxylase biotin carboxyl carrier protein
VAKQCRKVTAFLFNEQHDHGDGNVNSTKEGFVDLKDIKAIIDLMKKNSISEFELERQDFKIRLRRGGAQVISAEEPSNGNVLVPAPGVVVQSMPAALPGPGAGDVEIKSPMIGTLYRAPSPESNNYVEIGSEVNPETVVCIIEAMKVMNEIKAEVRGVITSILIDNAKPVEFGQPIFKIRPL